MKILTAQQLRQADAYSIAHEPVKSVDLMERAAQECFRWIKNKFDRQRRFKIFCGSGNNGGDGLAIARMLVKDGFTAEVFIVRYSQKSSEDFLVNEKRLQETKIKINTINSVNDIPAIEKNDRIIDAIFGTGLSQPPAGLAAEVIEAINKSQATIISIDMPSGLYADKHTSGEAIIHAAFTLSFQAPKLAFMFAENDKYVGVWNILDIRLDKKYIEELDSRMELISESTIKPLLKTRAKFSNKGNFGHALLIAGGYGKMGAAVLAARACLRTGAGLTTVHIPKCGYETMQAAVPEAMVTVDANQKYFSDLLHANQLAGSTAIGIGPGIGTEEETQAALKNLLEVSRAPLVLDADALNIIARHKHWFQLLPPATILTPHPKEFARLAGEAANDFERHQMQLDLSKRHYIYIVLKGAQSCITTPEGQSYFNTTGNPGMAKGGSGDVLTGIITSLLAQDYPALDAALLGTYLHGLAGDIAAAQTNIEGMIATDMIKCIPEAFIKIREDN